MYIKIEELQAAYKWAYIATVRGKKEITAFSNTKAFFIRSLEYASGTVVNNRSKIPATMIRRAKEGMIYRASLAKTPVEKRYAAHFLDRWFYMDAVFNGAMTMKDIETLAKKRMNEMGVEYNEVGASPLRRRLQNLLRKGYTIEAIKKNISRKAA